MTTDRVRHSNKVGPYIEDLDCLVRIDPDLDCPGEVRHHEGDKPVVVLREYDERVLLHECLHLILFREKEAQAKIGEGEERLVRWLTRKLYGMGWRLHETNRDTDLLERELNEVAESRDALNRILYPDTPARDFYRDPV